MSEHEKLLKEYAVAREEHKVAEKMTHEAYLKMKAVSSQAEIEWSKCLFDEREKFSKAYNIEKKLAEIGKSLK